MTHKIPLIELTQFIKGQPADKLIRMSQTFGLVSAIETGCYIFQFGKVTNRIEDKQIVSCGYSSIVVKDGDTFEFGVGPQERQDAFDINLEATQRGIGTYGELHTILQVWEDKNLKSKTKVEGMS